MTARSRTARRIRRDRARTNRAAARIARTGSGSLASHGIAAGLTPSEARSVASSLRRQVQRLGITGQTARVHAGRRMRDCTRYTPAQVATAATGYKPRKALYAVARQHFILAA